MELSDKEKQKIIRARERAATKAVAKAEKVAARLVKLQALLEARERHAAQNPKLPHGKKTCPSCQCVLPIAKRGCVCGHNFYSARPDIKAA